LDQLARVGVVQPPPEVADVDVDHVGLVRELVVPAVLGDHRPSEDAAGVAHQVFEDAELLVGEGDLPLGAPDAAAGGVEREVTGVQDWVEGVRGRRARARRRAASAAKANGLTR
jgi:hypothetical protein